MGLGYAGQFIGDIICPLCEKETHQPQAMTDGIRIYLVCTECGQKFTSLDMHRRRGRWSR